MKKLLQRHHARISEIFSSLQGEGPRMGERHLFIRFEECHLHCRYCDERKKRGRTMSLAEVLHAIDVLERTEGPHRYVCLTGGEPLLYVSFLTPLCQRLRQRKYKILLETNGVLGDALKEIVGRCDLISMDVKLASVSGEKDFFKEHAVFLKKAQKKETYVKMAVSRGINRRDFVAHLRMIAAIAPKIPVFLQPVSERGEGVPAPKLLRLLCQLQRIGKKYLSDVRVGIQLHKILNIC